MWLLLRASYWVVSENGSWGQDEMMVTFLTRFCHRCLPLGSPGPSLAPAGDSNKAANEGRRGRGHRGEVHAALAACPTASSLQTLPGSLRSRAERPGPASCAPRLLGSPGNCRCSDAVLYFFPSVFC